MITEVINYNTKKFLKSISSDTESLTFLFNDKYPTFPVEYMGFNITSLFLTEMEIKGFSRMIYEKDGVKEIFQPSFTNNLLTGLLSNSRIIRFVYENNLIKSFDETKDGNKTEWVYTRDNEGKLVDIRRTFNNISDDFKDILYSENDMIMGYNNRLKYNLFNFDVAGVSSFEADGTTYNVVYE
jgi:hypothetical protein